MSDRARAGFTGSGAGPSTAPGNPHPHPQPPLPSHQRARRATFVATRRPRASAGAQSAYPRTRTLHEPAEELLREVVENVEAERYEGLAKALMAHASVWMHHESVRTQLQNLETLLALQPPADAEPEAEPEMADSRVPSLPEQATALQEALATSASRLAATTRILAADLKNLEARAYDRARQDLEATLAARVRSEVSTQLSAQTAFVQPDPLQRAGAGAPPAPVAADPERLRLWRDSQLHLPTLPAADPGDGAGQEDRLVTLGYLRRYVGEPLQKVVYQLRAAGMKKRPAGPAAGTSADAGEETHRDKRQR